MMDSRVGDARDDCEIAAMIHLAATQETIACVITDISERGARLVVDAERVLPRRFVLALPLLDDQYDHRPVEMRWQRGAISGVQFLHPRSATDL